MLAFNSGEPKSESRLADGRFVRRNDPAGLLPTIAHGANRYLTLNKRRGWLASYVVLVGMYFHVVFSETLPVGGRGMGDGEGM